VQAVVKRGRVRVAVRCDENCSARATGLAHGLALRGSLQRLAAGKTVVFELRASKRIRRALAKRGTVAVTVRARDAAGNVATAKLTVRVKR
jgi:hypothetical protein